jgi:2-amino-4-hydroxy-6-hydroxymethyldihydropteridine diphosphokinase
MYRKHKLNENLEIFSSVCFPYKSKCISSLRYKVTIGVGGNIGDMKRRMNHLFMRLKREKRVDVIQTSLILKNPPFGYVNQDDFFNSIMILQTSMTPKVFLSYLLHLEKQYGRERSFANAPRTLDLDIIFFDNLSMNTERLTLPHPHWHERESVLIPLLGLKK